MNNQVEILIESSKLAKVKTNNILHLILTVFTAGLWIFIWLLVALSNSIERRRLERRIRYLSTGISNE